ncbi:type II CRISPR RNA-guided endonuclease Cas9 [Corynebacterium sp. H113]|uniref:type II CRISPR RNA-guided endonuclease Cas9 n=1 Tax=Corynebacterium sp. H113 TaxID=3133419 RepID=UPI0030ABEC2A
MRYCVGIDVGLHSVGFSAIELDDSGFPKQLLNCMSLIHDAGLDPHSQKEAKTRKLVAGVARRTRRMYKARKKRLEALDSFLIDHGYPIVDLEKEPDRAGWHARAQLATAKIEDGNEAKKQLSIAVRHIARHRGWRNPYVPAEKLRVLREPSSGFVAIQERARELTGQPISADSTLAQLVVELPDQALKLRGEDGLLSERMHQQDFANEILRIASVQQLDTTFVNELISAVFAAKSPKGSAKEFVGHDELDPTQYRAWRATIPFQEYRIISLLANIRIKDTSPGSHGAQRPMTVEERQKAFKFLSTWYEKTPPTWEDVAQALGMDRGALRGTASTNDDGERVTSTPPINETDRAFRHCSIKPIREFWKNSSAGLRIALIRQFSNVDIPDDDAPETIAASTLIRNLSAEDLEKIEGIRLPDGRSAYSERTLSKLRDHILNNEADLHSARKAIFDIDDNWKPAAPPIAEPTGNPAVDRVLKAVNRWLLLAESRWGTPESINIEHMRDGFKSEYLARQIERDQARRFKRNRDNIQEMSTKLGIGGRPRRSEVLRFQAIQRQNGQCAYCGTTIDFKSAELDHIVPRAGVGATNARVNLLATCHSCNLEKGKTPFAVWASRTNRSGVSLEKAVERVRQWPTDPGLSARDMKNFQDQVILRLKRISEDEEIDARSKESVAWMANELRHRITGYFSTVANSDTDNPATPKIRVFRGSITAAARKASGIENSLRMHGGRAGKNRLDRRHHAIDASVVALMQDYVAQALAERDSLRSQEHMVGRPDPLYGPWKEYAGRSVEVKAVFNTWIKKMSALVPLLQEALDEDRIPVTENLRLRLGNSLVHEETVHPLTNLRLGDAIPVEIVDRAATPALWCALTREPDFDWKEGLPENPNRSIKVNGRRLNSEDSIQVFGCKAGAISVRGGYCELGGAFHHARLYRITNGKKISYAMMRVYTADLAKFRNEDLFDVELPPQSISVRQCEKKLRTAFRDGSAEYITWFVVGDELHFDARKVATGQASTFLSEFGDVRSWRVRGFYTDSRLRLKPNQFSAEGLMDDSNPDCRKIIDAPGWRPTVNRVFSLGTVTIVRRDAHGRARLASAEGLPTSVKV